MAYVIQHDSGETELVLDPSETEVPVRTEILQGLFDEHNALARVLLAHADCTLDTCTTLVAVGPVLVAQWKAQPRPKREVAGSSPAEDT